VKQNLCGFPKFQGISQREEQSAQYTAYIFALKWHDKKDIYMFSPVHDSSMAPTWKRHSNTGQKILKP
jgi:hypothetical protein